MAQREHGCGETWFFAIRPKNEWQAAWQQEHSIAEGLVVEAWRVGEKSKLNGKGADELAAGLAGQHLLTIRREGEQEATGQPRIASLAHSLNRWRTEWNGLAGGRILRVGEQQE
jgi:hypothetical protein